jgi:hypothetical protein
MEKSKVMERPNIFEIATKELSQDAFITWLLKWADDSYKATDEDLHQCGKEFVSTLIKNQYPNFSESINKVEAGRQWKKIDVWAKVNDKYLIIIEDKINSRDHSEQLKRYKEFAEEKWNGNNKEKPICIYLKTGNECEANLKKIKDKKEYYIFDRKDFINLLNKFGQIKNNIFVDFRDRMSQIDNLTNGYKVKISDWKGKDSKCDECKYYAWQGLYKEIETKIENEGWGYMDNRSGGFLGFILARLKCGRYPIFIQLEQETFVFKISTNPKDVELPEEEIKKIRKQVRNEISSKLIEKAKQKGYNEIIKPSRYGEGVYMAIAIVEQKNWLGADEDIVNVDKVVENLKKYLEFSKEFVEEYNGKE